MPHSSSLVRLAMAALLLLSLAACDRAPPLHISDQAPSFSLPSDIGDSVKSRDYSGKAMLVVFWATWCPPCVQEIPTLMALQRDLGPRGFSVIGISLDEDAAAVLPKARARYQFNYPVAIGDVDVVAAFGNFSSLPTAFLVDKEGKLRARYVGGRDYAELKEDIELALQAKP